MSGNAAGALVAFFTCLTRVACVAGSCYLTMHEHPVMAAWTLVLAFMCGISWSSDEESRKKKENKDGS